MNSAHEKALVEVYGQRGRLALVPIRERLEQLAPTSRLAGGALILLDNSAAKAFERWRDATGRVATLLEGRPEFVSLVAELRQVPQAIGGEG
jgi:hypothetical protein